MRFSLCVVFVCMVFFGACSPQNPATYTTPFGTIEAGYTQETVKQILGNPHKIMGEENMDIWYYYFKPGSQLFVYFKDGRVIDVQDKEDVIM